MVFSESQASLHQIPRRLLKCFHVFLLNTKWCPDLESRTSAQILLDWQTLSSSGKNEKSRSTERSKPKPKLKGELETAGADAVCVVYVHVWRLLSLLSFCGFDLQKVAVFYLPWQAKWPADEHSGEFCSLRAFPSLASYLLAYIVVAIC